MDPLTDLLDAPRARGAFLLRVTMTPPWAVRVQDEAPLAVVAVTDGSACFVPDAEEPVRLEAGDVLLIARPEPYLFADRPAREPQAVIHSGGRCETPDGSTLEFPTYHGVRTWGNDADGTDSMLVGTYQTAGEIGSRILAALPPHLLLRSAEWHSPLVDVLAGQIRGDGIGQGSLLDRLLDALVVEAIQHWVRAAGDECPGWLRSDADPVVRDALELIHDGPSRPWTVASLAGAVGLSRAGFARRFAGAVGESPMRYLAGWRMALAADLLQQSDVPIATVAGRVGYDSPFTFSTAFKRRYGVSPLGYRREGRLTG